MAPAGRLNYDAGMTIRVEFFGIARQRAGVAMASIELPADATLAGVFAELSARLPGFGDGCLRNGQLAPTLAANLGGERFVTDPSTPINPGDCLLILSADAGG
ncbi:MAG: MoaD/ThiS family protein [Pirellulaceae bacterium]|nr:MoaD/ThiS family protein [Pirellulaceae bacterium]